jgi:hypothetical protein
MLRALLDLAKAGRFAVTMCRCDALVQAGYVGRGGVLSMARGTARFDAVAISGTGAIVRAGPGGDATRADARGGGCRRTGCEADCGGQGCVGYAQRGGVVSMDDGAVTFIGGNISNTTGVRVRMLRLLHVCCMLQLLMLYAARRTRRCRSRGTWCG